jgi:hypothetical protein
VQFKLQAKHDFPVNKDYGFPVIPNDCPFSLDAVVNDWYFCNACRDCAWVAEN